MRTPTTVLTSCCVVLPLPTASAETLPTPVNCDHHPHNTWIQHLMQNLMRAFGALHA